MNRILFATKRAYHRGLAKAAPLVRDLGLTPARYDLMFLLFTRNMPARSQTFELPMTQANLRHALGVCRETVRRMLVGLEEKGFVRRKPLPTFYRDRRSKAVHLTMLGRTIIRRATKILFPDGLMTGARRERREPLHVAYEMALTRHLCEKLGSLVEYLARRFDDRATYAYPDFDPDD
jgi:DNA-binding MarR family transcriptional regulator